MRIVHWAHHFAFRQSITDALAAEAGVDATLAITIDELAAALPGADALVMNDPPLEQAAEVGALLRAPTTTVRWIHVVGAGREGLIASGGAPEGVIVTGPAGAHAAALAEHAMAFMLAWTRRIPEFALATQTHTWAADVRAKMTSLEGQTLAIVGPETSARPWPCALGRSA